MRLHLTTIGLETLVATTSPVWVRWAVHLEVRRRDELQLIAAEFKNVAIVEPHGPLGLFRRRRTAADLSDAFMCDPYRPAILGHNTVPDSDIVTVIQFEVLGRVGVRKERQLVFDLATFSLPAPKSPKRDVASRVHRTCIRRC